jgi:hypothetical protein
MVAQKRLQLSLQTFLFLVRLAGIEPTTPWFVAKYSIQLSYSRQFLNYNVVTNLKTYSKISEATIDPAHK